jgi:hypothetical protein
MTSMTLNRWPGSLSQAIPDRETCVDTSGHDLVAMGRYFCEYTREEVNRPEAVRFSEKKRQARKLKPQAPSTARPRA